MSLLLLKKLAPYIAVLLLLIAIYAWHKSEIREAVEANTKEIEDAQALVLAKRTLENEKEQIRRDEIYRSTYADLERRHQETTDLAADLTDRVKRSRVCIDAPSGRTLPEPANPAAATTGATEGAPAVKSIGEDTVALVTQCQVVTDQLIGWQAWWANVAK